MNTKPMTGRTGRPVPKQIVINMSDGGKYFKSYDSLIAYKPADGGPIQLDEAYWDYSTTTGKYRNIFLGETKKETEAKIKSGEYILTNLNKNQL